MTPPSRRQLRRSLSALLLCAIAAVAWIGATRCRLEHPHASALLLDRHGAFLAQLHESASADYGYWPLSALPDRVVTATLGIEDRRFWWHPGVDPLAVGRALAQNWRASGRRSGASTIAMQVARLQDPSPRTYLSKAVESVTAMLLTLRYGHEELLRQYLTLAPYGQGSHGIAHAARWYFDKPIEDLSWAEIAFLGAIPQAPGLMNPGNPSGRERIQARGRRILAALAQEGAISAGERADAEAELDRIAVGRKRRLPDALHPILRTEEMRVAGTVGPDRPSDAVLRSTLDIALQRQVAKLGRHALAEWRGEGAEQLAVLVADRESLEVRAAFGSASYFAEPAGSVDFTRRDRSPGSALKPFIYALGLDSGVIGPDSVLEDLPYNRSGVDNADRTFLGPLLPAQALANSRNVPATNLVRQIGVEPTFRLFRDLGLVSDAHAASYYGLVMAIGAVPTRLDRLVAAYGALANDGMLTELAWVKGQRRSAPERVVSVAAAREIGLFLSDPLARLPSFPRMGTSEYPFPVAVKTGTSQGYRDAWAVAYSRRYIVGVWVGRSNAGSMDGLTGSRSAGRLVHDIMMALHQGSAAGDADLTFPAPPLSAAREICAGEPEEDGSCMRRLSQWMPIVQASARIEQATPARPSIAILSPDQHARLIRNPEMPAGLDWIALRVRMDGVVGQILWWVDGRPFTTADVQVEVRWPLAPGTHRFQAQSVYSSDWSAPVTIEVE
jgi:penicillin-binding protein 1C